MSDDLQNLIHASKRGDITSFQRLHALFVNRAYSVCFRLLADVHKAEDACQETFIKVWQQLPQFRGDSSFATWLHSIATRTAIDAWRKDKSLRLVAATTIEELTAPSDEPVSKSLEQAIAQLPHQARAVFILFAIEGYTHKEIAQLLAIAEGSSKAHYHRARKILQEVLSEQ